ncbi:ATP-dependent RNA helicase DbpA [subsurface metagenome]
MSEPKEFKNNNGKKSLLASDRIEVRKYQHDISNSCVKKNSLVVLPTGLGKTVIGAMVAAKTIQIYPDQSKVIMLAPTRPLIDQHYKSFLRFLEIPEDKFTILTGKVPPKDRVELFEANQIIFYTPQTLRNDLVSRKYSLEKTCLIIFDEAHHASGDYPYTLIADEYKDQNPDGNILALTASPGASKKKVIELCNNLHIPIDNIHIRTRKDADVKSFVKPMDIGKIGVNLTEFMEDSHSAIRILIEERLHYLSQTGFLQKEPDFDKIIRKDLLKLNAELVDMVKSLGGDKSRVYSAISINAQALILYHMIELIEQQGLDILLIYLEKVYKDARKHSSSKAVKILASEGRLRDVYIELKRNEDLSPQYLTHPKYKVLEQLILQEISKAPESKILVFVKLRDSVKNIVEKLRTKEVIRPVRFVGQATKSKDDKGLSQKKQIAILEQFKTGNFNVLVSTNVGEEGLDIAECDLVIFYDIVASEIRLIQRKGRTARHREGKVIILFCKNTNDEIYLKIALNKLKKMNANLKNPKSLRSYEKTQKGDHIRETKISTRSDTKTAI